MKRLLLYGILLLIQKADAQMSITDRFGNTKTVQIGTEPWLIQNSVTVAGLNTNPIYQKGKVAIGNYSTISTVEVLDIDNNARIRSIPVQVSTHGAAYNSLVMANRSVVAEEDGTLGYQFTYAASKVITANTDLSSLAPDQLASIHIGDWNALQNSKYTIILPPATDFANKILRVYFWGGSNSSFAQGTIEFNSTLTTSRIGGGDRTSGFVTVSGGGTRLTIAQGTGTAANFIRTFHFREITFRSTGAQWLYTGPI